MNNYRNLLVVAPLLCINLVPSFNLPSCVSGIFGQKLEETVRYERRFGNKPAPMLVEQCVDFIRQWGLQEEGLFRLPGQANLVKELQDAFDCGEKPSFDWWGDVWACWLVGIPQWVLMCSWYSEVDCGSFCQWSKGLKKFTKKQKWMNGHRYTRSVDLSNNSNGLFSLYLWG